ncbi:SAM-dependent methyltransferase [Frankia sp. CNm7]|uniref:SAM-dependent methyltransferase n=1 Tax=Frankia nepalensis TaxID=1836974 RepID=A0A937RGP3_9ACTN|nr:SAM-dependent methyltransferase [Frankia nepalensis]MBL7495594.1 SAM-dependent methyltransferase [Frankia nepalensis]MBL7508840.1 SAM-dependent methyltransferase [Frankia nepalensis]MBL7522113.1 SAM-dependent methyltransferase [Frankia nepalensis]MBL7630065.1 SAM-dependent methyltransferase [Frankia nepalensis]
MAEVGTTDLTSLAGPVDPVVLRTDVPHTARIYDYYLGGKDNFPADRQAAEQTLAVYPHAPIAARQNREFVRRAIRFLAAEVGIRQFLDVGTGIPTSPNLHEIAQGIAPESRIVYADNDPIVLAHARALLASTPQGKTAYLDADLREPEKILHSAELRDTLDLSKPVVLSVIAILHFIPDSDDPLGLIRRYLDALPTGSYLALTHGTADFASDVARAQEVYRKRGISGSARSRDEVARFFEGLDLVEPGIVPVHRWRPDGTIPEGLTDAQVSVYGAVARIS